MSKNKKRLLKLWEKSLPKINNYFSGNPLDLNKLSKKKSLLARDVDHSILKELLGDYIHYQIDNNIIPIFFKEKPPLIIFKCKVKHLHKKVYPIKRKVYKKILGIKIGTKTVNEKPEEMKDISFFLYDYSRDDNGDYYYKIYKNDYVYFIRFGKIMSILTEDEYNKCVQEYKETSIRVDNDKLDERLED